MPFSAAFSRGRRDGLLLDLDGLHLAREPRASGRLSEPMPQYRSTARPRRVGRGEAQGRRVQDLAHGAVGLQEGGRRHAQVDAGEALAQVRRPEQHVRVRRRRRRRRGDSLTVTANEVQPLAAATRAASSASSGKRARDEQVEQQVAAGAALADDEVAQQARRGCRASTGARPRARQASATACRARFMRSDASWQS